MLDVNFWAKELMTGLLRMEMMAMMIAVTRYSRILFEDLASRFWV